MIPAGKIGQCGGHHEGHNVIPPPWNRQRPEYRAYCEGTQMRLLSISVAAAHPKVYNARPEKGDPSLGLRAKRMKDAHCDYAIEMNTNWSINRTTGQPNRGTMSVIVSLCYEDGAKRSMRCAEEMRIATEMWKPLADKWGLRFKAVTRKSFPWNNDWYGFIRFCKQRGIAHPQILEMGYHQDFAEHVAEYTQDVVKRYGEILEAMKPALPVKHDVCPYAKPAALPRLGDAGDAVKWLQWHLSRLVYMDGVDGTFGGVTQAALERFNAENRCANEAETLITITEFEKYTVKPGDTPYSIMHAHGQPGNEWNRIKRVDRKKLVASDIHPGEELWVPTL